MKERELLNAYKKANNEERKALLYDLIKKELSIRYTEEEMSAILPQKVRV